MTEQGVIERRIFDYLCSVNAQFAVRVFRVTPVAKFLMKAAGFIILGRRLVTVCMGCMGRYLAGCVGCEVQGGWRRRGRAACIMVREGLTEKGRRRMACGRSLAEGRFEKATTSF